MFTRLKNHGASSTAGANGKRGHKGRLELVASRTEDDKFTIDFRDFGGFGKLRWEANFGTLENYEIRDIIQSLQDLLHGTVDTTEMDVDDLNVMIVEAMADVKAQNVETVAEPVSDEEEADLLVALDEPDSVESVDDLSC